MSQFYYASSLSKNIDMTPEGFLICKDVAITRAGDFFYTSNEVSVAPDINGIVRMIRSLEEVVSPETIASFEGKPLTLLHPDDEVTPNNYSDVTVGTVQNVRRGTGNDMDKLIADLIVMEKNAIEAVMNKEMREVSVGFSADQIQISPGIGMQEGIRGNHVAIVPLGRAGHAFAIRDSLTVKETEMGLKDRILKSFGKALDEALPKDAEQESADEAAETETAISAFDKRLGAIEASVSKLVTAIPEQLEKIMASKDAAFTAKPAAKTYDSETLSRAEILAPGVDLESSDIELDSLTQSYDTEEGKKTIDSMLGGKGFSVVSKDAALKRTIFVAAAEIIKAKRTFDMGAGFADAAYASASTAGSAPKRVSPEERNKLNKAFYSQGVK